MSKKRYVREVFSNEMVGDEVISMALRGVGYYALAVKRVYIDPKVVADMWKNVEWAIVYANGNTSYVLGKDEKACIENVRFVYMAYIDDPQADD